MPVPVSFLSAISLFKGFDNDLLKAVASHLSPREFAPQSVIIEEGKLGHSLFLISEGQVEVTRRGRSEPVAQLGARDFFGEMAILFRQRRAATVKALTQSLLYELSADVFSELFEAQQEAMAEIKKEARKRKYFLNPQHIRTNASTIADMKAKILAQKLASLHFFQDIEPSFLEVVAKRLNRVMTTKNQVVFSQGDLGDGLYIIARGQVKVIDTTQGSALNTLESGDIFGELALLQEAPRNATIQTEDFCELYKLNTADFKAVMDNYPEIADKIQAVARKRDTESMY